MPVEETPAGDGAPEPKVIPLTMTDKQLYASVTSGQKITFDVFDGDPISGYLAGLDEERMFVLEPIGHERIEFRKRFIDRRSGGTPVFEIHSDHAYRTEPGREAMESIIGSFRQWIAKNILKYRDRSPRPARFPRQERVAP